MSLRILIIITSLYLINYSYTQTLYNVYSDVLLIYKRLEAEKDLYDEILFRLYIYDFDDFDYVYEDYEFKVKMSETNINVKVLSPDEYVIDIIYADDCLCFTSVNSSKIEDY